MKLSVIIPAYKEPKEIIYRAISSVKNQLYYTPDGVEILVINDNPGNSIDSLDGVTILNNETNIGPGNSRQKGIDKCTGEYIAFLDADDIFYNLLFYSLFLRDVYWRTKNIDIARFPMLQQKSDGYFSQMGHESTWCIGKVFRKQFLVENNIRFNPDISYAHEDSWFIRYAEIFNPNQIYHTDLVYLWNYNPESITRNKENQYEQKYFDKYIDVIYGIQREKLKRGMDIEGEAIYSFSFCYMTISRMDEEFSEKCIDKMTEYLVPEEIDYIIAHETLDLCIRDAQNVNNAPRGVAKMTVREFYETIKRKKGLRNAG